jgi:WD40 repeat protein
MTHNRDFFTRESVDEQVEQLSSRQSGKPARLEPGTEAAQANMRRVRDFPTSEDGQEAPELLVKDLQAFYQTDYAKNKASLARARRRIAAHRFTSYPVYQERNPMDSVPGPRFSQERMRQVPSPRSMEQSRGRRLSRGLSLLAAVLVAGLLVGMLTVVLTMVHSQQGSRGIGEAKATATSVPTPTPTPMPVGTILSTRKPPMGTNFGSAAWSPDGTRIAAPVIDLLTEKTQVDIWDAASGKKLLAVPLQVASLDEVLWSPTGKYLALDNLQTIVILDSHSGAVVKTINYSPPTAFNAPGASQQLRWARNAPRGGGFGFYSVAWSPNGTFLAVAVSDLTTGRVVLLNPQTGQVKTTLRQQARPIGSSLSFSSDGKYLAVSYTNDSTIVVWDVATQHVVFVLTGAQSMTIAWQPGTHHLARSTFSSVELWNVDTHKQLKTYQGGSAFAWSPDGKELVTYASPFASPFSQPKTTTATILDSDTGTPVGRYTSQNQLIFSASWSPNGHAIATTEESSANSNQIVVWAA